MPSGDAALAQYGLGAALSCDALGWKHGVKGRCSLGRCFPRCGAALGGLESVVLGVAVYWAKNVQFMMLPI